MKLYTKGGDKGVTSTLSGRRIQKCHCLIDINGSIDSLQSQLMKLLTNRFYKDELEIIYEDLMRISSEVSFEKELDNSIQKNDIKKIEKLIDELYNTKLEGFVKFTNEEAIEFNEARVRTRELERKIVDFSNDHTIREMCITYINRLSTLLFIMAVEIDKKNYCIMCNDEIHDDSEPYLCINCKGYRQ